MFINELMEREDFSTMSPLEIQYLLTDDEHKEAFALGVAWTLLLHAREDLDGILLWAERAKNSVVLDGDVPVGFSDCPDRPIGTTVPTTVYNPS